METCLPSFHNGPGLFTHCIVIASETKTFYLSGKPTKTQDGLRGGKKHSILQGNSLSSGSKRLKHTRKSLKLIRFASPYLSQVYAISKDSGQTLSEYLSCLKEAHSRRVCPRKETLQLVELPIRLCSVF